MKRPRGQSLVEFALVLPVLFLIIFGILDLGRAVYIYNTLSNAARQGVRVASVDQNDANGQCDPLDRTSWSIVACVKLAGISLNLRTQDISDICYYDASQFSDCDGTQLKGDSCTQKAVSSTCIARVTVDYPYVPLTPIIGDLVGTMQLSSTSEMPVESWYTP